MNLQPVALFDLQPISPEIMTGKFVDRETLSISKKNMRISKKMFTRLGCPEKVEFGIDKEKKVFGIKAAEAGSKFSFEIYHPNEKGSYYIRFARDITDMLLRMRNVNGNSRYMILIEPWSDSGYFVFDIDKAYVKKIEKRNK